MGRCPRRRIMVGDGLVGMGMGISLLRPLLRRGWSFSLIVIKGGGVGNGSAQSAAGQPKWAGTWVESGEGDKSGEGEGKLKDE